MKNSYFWGRMYWVAGCICAANGTTIGGVFALILFCRSIYSTYCFEREKAKNGNKS